MGDNYCRYSRSDVGRPGRRRPRQPHRRSGDTRFRPDCHPDFHLRAARRRAAHGIACGSAEDALVDVLLVRAVAETAAPRTCLVRRTCPVRHKAAAPKQAARSATARAQEAAPAPARIISCSNAFSFHHYATVVLWTILRPMLRTMPRLNRRPGRRPTLRLLAADRWPDLQAALVDPRAPPHPPALRTKHRTCSAHRNFPARPNP